MKKFNEWLSVEEHYRHISPVEIQVLFNEIATHEVSMKGNGIFTLTYSAVASVNALRSFNKMAKTYNYV